MPSHALKQLSIIWISLVTLACALTSPSAPQGVIGEVAPAPSGELQVTFVTPLEQATYLEGVGVNIMARISGAGTDIDRVEVLVDNNIIEARFLPNPMGAETFTFTHAWQSSGAGTHTLSLVVFRANGSGSTPVSRTVEVVSNADNTLVLASQSGSTDNATNTTEANATTEDTASTQPTVAPLEPTAPPADAAAPTEQPQATAVPPTDAPPSGNPQGTILVGSNIRSGPGTEYGTIGSYAANQAVDVLGKLTDDSWFKIKYYNGEGWIAGSLISVPNASSVAVIAPPPTPTPTPGPPTAAPPQGPNLVFNGTPLIQPFPPKCKDVVAFYIRVQNNGQVALGSGWQIYIRDIHVASNSMSEFRATFDSIPAGQWIELPALFLSVDTNFDSEHRIEVILDSANNIAETNEGDNIYETARYTLAKGAC
ncbi:MAG: SH3 domain-containing protein [Phototrophicaceae bacterium]